MRTLYITEQGSSIHLKSHQLEIHRHGDTVMRIPTESITNLMLFGGVSITSSSIKYLSQLGTDIAFMTQNGKFTSRVTSAKSKNIPLRIAQYRLNDTSNLRLQWVHKIITMKMENSLQLLENYTTNSHSPYKLSSKVKSSLLRIKEKVVHTVDIDTIRGLEGVFGRIYFGEYSQLFTHSDFVFNKRVFHPATDPVNALLSLGYSLLSHEIESLCEAHGLDPYMGFMHTIAYGRPSLSLDLVEPFRSKVIDRMILFTINKKQLRKENFIIDSTDKAIRLTHSGMKQFLTLYEEQMNTEKSAGSYRNEIRKFVEEYIEYLRMMEV